LISIEEAVARLAGDPNFRILKRLDAESVGGPPLTSGSIRRAAIVDTETTGMDPQSDQVIEIGIVVFEYAADTGQIGPVVRHLNAMEDPGRPIPPEATAVHHITDEMVKGRRFDDASVTQALADVSLVIAHNSNFDRPFLEARFPIFQPLPWACSIRDIAWRDAGYGSSSLEFLAYRMGFFFDGHRAETDCRAVLAILGRPLGGSPQSVFQALLECARKPVVKLYALNSPFESKDKLKERGYRWAAQEKVWVGEFPATAWDEEAAWIKEAVYAGASVEVQRETLDARIKYSGRPGRKERVAL
jgi:DNA polymerase III subunit epsilon